MVPYAGTPTTTGRGSYFPKMFFVLLLGLLQVSVNARGPNYYTAAVFEHVRYDDSSKSTPEEQIQENLNRYATAAETAAKQGADIIVFPEWGLYRHDKTNRSTALPFAEDVPDPSGSNVNPCESESDFKDRPVLLRLSCLAKRNAMFLVANIVDIKNCVPDETCSREGEECPTDSRRCPSDGIKLFNTNVVFDRSGTLVSRYYKYHLFFEPDFNIPAYPKPAYFETDFGLFTTFICFDMTYRESVDSVEERRVMNVAYPTFWFDHLPTSSAIQFQQAWAMVNKVNLLAADVHLPGTGTVGSGIYSGTKGALIYTFNPDGEAKLLISRVPTEVDEQEDFETHAKIFRIRTGEATDITDKRQDSAVPDQCSYRVLGFPKNLGKDYRCNEINTTGHAFKKLEGAEGTVEVCENGLCCGLTYSADSMDEPFYLLAWNDVLWLRNVYGFCTQACTLVRCDTLQEDGPCTSYPLSSKTRFHKFELSGTFTTKYVYPSVLKSKMRLAPTEEWTFQYENGGARIVYDSTSDEGGAVLTSGLNGRCYDGDPVIPL